VFVYYNSLIINSRFLVKYTLSLFLNLIIYYCLASNFIVEKFIIKLLHVHLPAGQLLTEHSLTHCAYVGPTRKSLVLRSEPQISANLL